MTVHPPLADAGCNAGAVAGTFLMGIALGPVSGAVIAIVSHVVHELSRGSAASLSLVVSLMFTVFGGIVIGVASSVGAALALWVVDSRLRRPWFVQGTIAGVGALVPAIGVYLYVTQTATGNAPATIPLFAFIFAIAFALMVLRSKKHHAPPSRASRRSGTGAGI